MDSDEQQLQRDGYVKAFRHPEVIRAITEGPRGRIAVTFFEWAGTEYHSVVAPWTIIASRKDAEAFADRDRRRALHARDRHVDLERALLRRRPVR